MSLLCADPRAAPSPAQCESNLTNTSTETLSRYERIISLLSRQVTQQQREIAELKATLPRDGKIKKSGGSAAGLPVKWRRAVEEETVALLEAHLRGMDERIAKSLTERFRRVTREHVVRSIDKQVHRALRESTIPLCSAPVAQYAKQQEEEQQQEEEEIKYGEEKGVRVAHFSSSPCAADALQRQITVLERRLAEAARSAMSAPTEKTKTISTSTTTTGTEAELQSSGVVDQTLPPPSAASPSEERYENRESWRWPSSSCSLTNSANTSTLSDSVEMLMDVFQGRQSIKAVQQLLE